VTKICMVLTTVVAETRNDTCRSVFTPDEGIDESFERSYLRTSSGPRVLSLISRREMFANFTDSVLPLSI